MNKNKYNNYLSFDIEDWFQVPFVNDVVKQKDWGNMSSIVEDGTAEILTILNKHKVKATFFVLGWIAKKYPELVKEIAKQGHEIASHGYGHQTLDNISKAELDYDLKKSNEVISKITNKPIIGYRAPMGSIGDKNIWVLDVLINNGFKYDSSIYTSSLLVHSGSRHICDEITEIKKGFWEVPLSVETYMKIPVPISGGFYLRSLPFFLFKKLMKKRNKAKKTTVLYYHPWEFSTQYPQIAQSYFKRFIQYYNLPSVKPKLEELLKVYDFVPISNIFE